MEYLRNKNNLEISGYLMDFRCIFGRFSVIFGGFSVIFGGFPDNFLLFKVCPWTLFLTMSLTLLKGLMPHIPAMLPLLVSDPEMRERAEETFLSPEFQENIEEYFVNNIKVIISMEKRIKIVKSMVLTFEPMFTHEMLKCRI